MAYYHYHNNNIRNSNSSNYQLQWMNSPFGDTTYTKLFVGGLAWETQSHTLRRHFEQFGDILEAVVIFDKSTARSKGYGFVTFGDAESARRACADPNPIIDGRKANCNLAFFGRSHTFPSNYGYPRSPMPLIRSMHTPRVAYSGNPGYHQPIPYSNQPGFIYPPYGYASYGSEYVYPQGVYNPYAEQQYIQVCDVPRTVNHGVNSSGQSGHPLHSIREYSALQSYAMPGHDLVQFGGLVNRTTSATVPAIQAPCPSGIATPDTGQAQEIRHSPQFTSGSDQTAN